MQKYNLTLIIEFDGESGKRESRTYTLPDSQSRVTLPHHGGEIRLAEITPDTVRVELFANERVRSFAVGLGSVLRLPLGAPLKRGSVEIHVDRA